MAKFCQIWSHCWNGPFCKTLLTKVNIWRNSPSNKVIKIKIYNHYYFNWPNFCFIKLLIYQIMFNSNSLYCLYIFDGILNIDKIIVAFKNAFTVRCTPSYTDKRFSQFYMTVLVANWKCDWRPFGAQTVSRESILSVWHVTEWFTLQNAFTIQNALLSRMLLQYRMP